MRHYTFKQERYVCEYCGCESTDEEKIKKCEASHCKEVKEFHVCLPDGNIKWTTKYSQDKGSYPQSIDVLYANGMTVRYTHSLEMEVSSWHGPKYEERWKTNERRYDKADIV